MFCRCSSCLHAAVVIGWLVLACGCAPPSGPFPTAESYGPGLVRGFSGESLLSSSWTEEGLRDGQGFGSQVAAVEGLGLLLMDNENPRGLSLKSMKRPERIECVQTVERLLSVAAVGDQDGDGVGDVILAYWEGRTAADLVSGRSFCSPDGLRVLGSWTWDEVSRLASAVYPLQIDGGQVWLLNVHRKSPSFEGASDGQPGGLVLAHGFGSVPSDVEVRCPEGTRFASVLPMMSRTGLALMNCFISGAEGSVLLAVSALTGDVAFRIESRSRVFTEGGFVEEAEGTSIVLRVEETTHYFAPDVVESATTELEFDLDDGVAGLYGAAPHPQTLVMVDEKPMVPIVDDEVVRLVGLSTGVGLGGFDILREFPPLDLMDIGGSRFVYWTDRDELVMSSPIGHTDGPSVEFAAP